MIRCDPILIDLSVVAPFGLHLLCKIPEVFMIPQTFIKSNSFLNITFFVKKNANLYTMEATIITKEQTDLCNRHICEQHIRKIKMSLKCHFIFFFCVTCKMVVARN